MKMNTIILIGNDRDILADRISDDTYCIDRAVTEDEIILRVI